MKVTLNNNNRNLNILGTIIVSPLFALVAVAASLFAIVSSIAILGAYALSLLLGSKIR